MPDDLYWDDTLLWSERQADLLRRLAAGERVNDVDWEHVIEEIEDVGKTELRTCTSLLRRAMEHLLKLQGWPGHASSEHWRNEIFGFLRDAAAAFTPSMHQKIELASYYRTALRDVRAMTMDGRGPASLPDGCPFDIDDLLADDLDIDALLARLDVAAPQGG
jgi:Domain of unknown function DUF29